MVSAYCLKEKKKQEVKNPEYGVNDKNRAFLKGTCASCGSKIQGFISADSAPPEIRAKIAAKKAQSAKKGGSQKRSAKKVSAKKASGKKHSHKK